MNKRISAFIALLVFIGINSITFMRLPERETTLQLKNIKTVKSETFHTASFCWWCSCYVTEHGTNSSAHYEYMKLIAAKYQ